MLYKETLRYKVLCTVASFKIHNYYEKGFHDMAAIVDTLSSHFVLASINNIK